MSTLPPLSRFNYRTAPLSNVTPLTYRDGATFQKILESMALYLSSNLPGDIDELFSALKAGVDESLENMGVTIDTTAAEYRELVQSAIDSFTRIVNTINDKTGNVAIQHLTLTANTTLTIDPAFPAGHEIIYTVTQNGNYTLNTGAYGGDKITVGTTPGDFTIFRAIKVGNTWNLYQPHSPSKDSQHDKGTAGLILNASTATRTALQTLMDVLEAEASTYTDNAIRDRVPGLVKTSIESGDAGDSVRAVTRAAILADLKDTATPIAQEVSTIGYRAARDKFPGVLRSWGAALEGRSRRAAVVVCAGSSTTAGFSVNPARSYVGRLAGLISGRPVSASRLDLTASSSRPATGGQVFTSVGSDSATYFTSAGISAMRNVQPDLIIHSIGSNDFASQLPLSTYKANLENWYNQIHNVSPQTVHVYMHQQPRQDRDSAAITWADYGRALKEFADARPNALFFDLSAKFPLGLPEFMKYGDNVHINDAGQALISKYIFDFIGLDSPGVSELLKLSPLPASGIVSPSAEADWASMLIKAAPYPRTVVGKFRAYAYTGDSNRKELGISIKEDGETATLVGAQTLLSAGSSVSNPELVESELSAHLEPNKAYRIIVRLAANIFVSGNSAYTQLTARTEPS